jgi:outer membrane protein assembly factor BamB
MKMSTQLHDAAWQYGARTPARSRRGNDAYEVSVRHPGTPVLSVTARGAHSWKVELPYQDEHPISVLNGSVLVVVAKPLETTASALRVIGLDVENGRVLYEQPLCQRNLGVTSILANGPNVVLTEGWSGVWSFDAQTGRVLWRSGACG